MLIPQHAGWQNNDTSCIYHSYLMTLFLKFHEFSDTPALLTPCQETYWTSRHLRSSSRAQLVLTTVTKPLMATITFPMSRSLKGEKLSIVRATLGTASNCPWKSYQKGSEKYYRLATAITRVLDFPSMHVIMTLMVLISSSAGINFSWTKFPLDPSEQRAMAVGAGMVTTTQRIIAFINSLYMRWNKLDLLYIHVAFMLESTIGQLHDMYRHINTFRLFLLFMKQARNIYSCHNDMSIHWWVKDFVRLPKNVRTVLMS